MGPLQHLSFRQVALGNLKIDLNQIFDDKLARKELSHWSVTVQSCSMAVQLAWQSAHCLIVAGVEHTSNDEMKFSAWNGNALLNALLKLHMQSYTSTMAHMC